MFKKLIFIFSILFNIIVLILLALTLTRKTASVSFLNLDGAKRYTTAACIVSTPSDNAGMVFGPVEFSLKTGEEAALQFSLFIDGRQMNLALTALYDYSVISAEPSGYGLIIRALKSGETTMQLFTGDGIRDIAHIIVHD